ncbi:hypothetical protein CKG00_17795 [Morganella morganii]|uniref:Uncharacterized protein n=1 Tax=Morganella morganii TaxID=582 RepID=A0A433ZQ18_MORMO|nr:hypothetical protein CKG00_17795 [Morganella morganii]
MRYTRFDHAYKTYTVRQRPDMANMGDNHRSFQGILSEMTKKPQTIYIACGFNQINSLRPFTKRED